MGFLPKKPSLISLFFGIFILSIQPIQLDAFFLFAEQQNPTADVVLREVSEYLARGLEIKSGDENGVSGQFLKRLGFDILIVTSRQINSGLIETFNESLLFKLIDKVYNKKLSDTEFVVLLAMSSLFTDDLAGLVKATKDYARTYLSGMVMKKRGILIEIALNDPLAEEEKKQIQDRHKIVLDKLDQEYVSTYRIYLTMFPKRLYAIVQSDVENTGQKLKSIDFSDGSSKGMTAFFGLKSRLKTFGFDVDSKFDFLLDKAFFNFNFGRLNGAFKWLEMQKDSFGQLNNAKVTEQLLNLQLFPVKENASFSKLLITNPEDPTAAPWTGTFNHQSILNEIRNFDLSDVEKLKNFKDKFLSILCVNISLTNDQRKDIATEMLNRIYEFKSSDGSESDFGLPEDGRQTLAEYKASIDSMLAQNDQLAGIASRQRVSGQSLTQQQEYVGKLQESYEAFLVELKTGALGNNSKKMAEFAFLIVNLNYWIDIFRRVATELQMDNLKFAFEAKFGDFWQFWRNPNLPLPEGRRTPQEDLFFQKRTNAEQLLSSAAQLEKVLDQQNKKLMEILNGTHAQDLGSVLAVGNPDFVINELWAIFASLSNATLNGFIAQGFEASRDQNKDKLDKIIEFFRGQVGDNDLADSLNFLFLFNQTARQSAINADMVSEISLRVKRSRKLCQEHIVTFQNVAQQKKAAFKSVSQGPRSGLISNANPDQNIYYDKAVRRLVVNDQAYGGKMMLSGLSDQADINAQEKLDEAEKYRDASNVRLITALGAPMIGAVGAGIATGMVASGPAAAIAIPAAIGVGSAVVGAVAGGQAAYDYHKAARAYAKSDKLSQISERLKLATGEEDSGDEEFSSSLPYADPSNLERGRGVATRSSFVLPPVASRSATSLSNPVRSNVPSRRADSHYSSQVSLDEKDSFEPEPSALRRTLPFVVPETSSIASRIQRAPQSLSSQRQPVARVSSSQEVLDSE